MTDFEVWATLLQQQQQQIKQMEKSINKACQTAIELGNDCPNQISAMIGECENDGDDYDCKKCWRRYLEEAAGNG